LTARELLLPSKLTLSSVLTKVNETAVILQCSALKVLALNLFHIEAGSTSTVYLGFGDGGRCAVAFNENPVVAFEHSE
jgi:hypothetical protein